MTTEVDGQSENIAVCIRVRPLNEREERNKDCNVLRTLSGLNVISITDREGQPLPGKQNVFQYDHIFDENISTREIYDKVAGRIVKSTLDGINGTIFAYGQTSSGKTFTMQGNGNNQAIYIDQMGVLQLAVEDIFNYIERSTDRDFLLRVSYVEIYNEIVKDLLNSSEKGNNLKLREDPRKGVYVECREEIITDYESIMQLLQQGEQRRTVGQTAMNERSSRSHSIFRIVIESKEKSSSRRESEDDMNGAVLVGCLSLVDLAGSESVRHTAAEGIRQREAGNINKSLLTLSRVINTLASGSAAGNQCAPFRDSKLTRLLQNSLDGNTRTLIVCCVTPSDRHLDETKSTLQFAARAKNIQTSAHVNEVLDDQAQLKRLKKEVHELKKLVKDNGTLTALKAENEALVEERNRKQQEIVRLLGLVLNSSSVENVSKTKKKTKIKRHRETWCPGDLLESIQPLRSMGGGHFFSPNPQPRKRQSNDMILQEESVGDDDERKNLLHSFVEEEPELGSNNTSAINDPCNQSICSDISHSNIDIAIEKSIQNLVKQFEKVLFNASDGQQKEEREFQEGKENESVDEKITNPEKNERVTALLQHLKLMVHDNLKLEKIQQKNEELLMKVEDLQLSFASTKKEEEEEVDTKAWKVQTDATISRVENESKNKLDTTCLRVEMEELKRQNENLQMCVEDLSKSREQSKDMEEDHTESKAMIAELLEENEVLRLTVDELSQKLAIEATVSKSENNAEIISRLKESLNEATNQIESLTQEKTLFLEQQAQQSAQSQENDSLCFKVEELQLSFEQSKSQYESKIQEMSCQNDSLRSNLKELQSEMEKALTAVSVSMVDVPKKSTIGIQSEIKDLKEEELEEMKQFLKSNENETNELKEKLAVETNQKEKLAEKLEKLEKEMSKIQQEAWNALTEQFELKKQLETLSETKNVVEMALAEQQMSLLTVQEEKKTLTSQLLDMNEKLENTTKKVAGDTHIVAHAIAQLEQQLGQKEQEKQQLLSQMEEFHHICQFRKEEEKEQKKEEKDLHRCTVEALSKELENAFVEAEELRLVLAAKPTDEQLKEQQEQMEMTHAEQESMWTHFQFVQLKWNYVNQKLQEALESQNQQQQQQHEQQQQQQEQVQNDKVQQIVVELEQLRKEKEEMTMNHAEEIKILEEQLIEMKTELSKSHETIETKNQSMKPLQIDLEALKISLESKIQEYTLLMEEKTGLIEELSGLETQLVEISHQKTQLEQENQKLLQDFSTLSTKTSTTGSTEEEKEKEEVEMIKARADKLALDVASYEETVTLLKEKLQIKDQTIHELEVSVQKQLEQVEDTETKLVTTEKQVKSCEETIRCLKEEMKELCYQKQQFTVEKDEMIRSLMMAEQNSSRMQDEWTRLKENNQTERENLEKEMERLRGEIVCHKEEKAFLRQNQTSNEETTCKIHELMTRLEENQEKEDALRRLQVEKDFKFKQYKEEMEEELQHRRERIEELEVLVEANEQKIQLVKEEASIELKKIQQQFQEENQQEISSLQQQLVQYEDQLSNMKDFFMNSHQKELNQLEKEFETFKQQAQDQLQQVQHDASQQLEQIQNELQEYQKYTQLEKSKVQKLDQKNEHLRCQYEEVMEKFEAYQIHAEEKLAKIQSIAEEEQTRMQEKYIHVQNELEEYQHFAQQEMNQLRKQLENVDTKYKKEFQLKEQTLMDQLEQFQQEKHRLEETKAQFQNTIQELQQQLEETKTKAIDEDALNKMKQKIEQLEGETYAHRNEIEELNECVKSSQMEAMHYHGELVKEQLSKEEMEKTLTTQKQRIEKLEKVKMTTETLEIFRKLKRERQQLAEQVQQLEQKLVQKKEITKEDVFTLDLLEKAQAEKIKLIDKISIHEQKIHSLEEQLKEKQQTTSNKVDKVRYLEKENLELHMENRKLQKLLTSSSSSSASSTQISSTTVANTAPVIHKHKAEQVHRSFGTRMENKNHSEEPQEKIKTATSRGFLLEKENKVIESSVVEEEESTPACAQQ